MGRAGDMGGEAGSERVTQQPQFFPAGPRTCLTFSSTLPKSQPDSWRTRLPRLSAVPPLTPSSFGSRGARGGRTGVGVIKREGPEGGRLKVNCSLRMSTSVTIWPCVGDQCLEVSVAPRGEERRRDERTANRGCNERCECQLLPESASHDVSSPSRPSFASWRLTSEGMFRGPCGPVGQHMVEDEAAGGASRQYSADQADERRAAALLTATLRESIEAGQGW